MIIRDIYFGTHFIRRIYKNGKLIRVDVPIAVIKGKAESETLSTASLANLKAGVISSSVDITSNSETEMKAIKLIAIQSDAETTTYTVSNAMRSPAKPMDAKAESFSDTKSKCYAEKFAVLGPVEAMIFTDAIATANSNKVALAESKVPINTEPFTETLRKFSPLPLGEVENKYRTYAGAEAQNIIPKNIGRGNSESTSDTIGNLTPYTGEVDFATASWAKIAEIAESGKANEVFAVGDKKLTKINGVDTVIEIIGFNHDDKADGSGKAGITMWVTSLTTCLTSRDDVSSNQKSWLDTVSYSYAISKVTFEDELAAVVKTVNKTYEVANNTYITSYSSIATKAWMISASELGYDLTYTSGAEGTVYEKFSSGKVKTKTYTDINLSTAYWTRSYPGSKSIFNAMGVTTAGKLTNAGSTTDRRYPSLCFCV